MFHQQTSAGDATLGAHYRQAARALGHSVDHFAPKGFVPEPLRFAWELFIDLSACRSSNGFGANPIAYVDLHAWSQLYDVTLSTLEISVVRRLDSVWLSVLRATQANKEQNNA